MGEPSLGDDALSEKDSHVVAVASIYGPAHRFLAEYMKRFGVAVTFVKGTDTEEIEEAIRENTDLIYLESPSTYLFPGTGSVKNQNHKGTMRLP